jgi:hypothetical protein
VFLSDQEFEIESASRPPRRTNWARRFRYRSINHGLRMEFVFLFSGAGLGAVSAMMIDWMEDEDGYESQLWKFRDRINKLALRKEYG